MVSGAVRRNRLLNKPSNAEDENEMKVWLRQSVDCRGGRRAREQNKVTRRINKSLNDDHLFASEDDVEND